MCGRAIQPSPSHLSCTAGSGASFTKSGGLVANWLRLISILHSLPMNTAPPIGASFALEAHQRAVGVLHRDDAVRAG